MIFKEWNILLVDDEPDVLTVSRLALKNVRVYGLPIKIHFAGSKAEAIDLIRTKLTVAGMPESVVAVAFIDVVMESDYAGLELCEYIRQDLHNSSTQLYIRTGQPGLAPERSVIDCFDISGYFTKVEATEDKLYTFVKSGIRQWYSIFYTKLIADLTNQEIVSSGTKEELYGMLNTAGDNDLEDDGNASGIIFDHDTVIGTGGDEKIMALRDELDELPPMMTTPEGHKVVVDGNRMMVRVVETAITADYAFVIEGFTPLPEMLHDITFRNGLALSILWKRAK